MNTLGLFLAFSSTCTIFYVFSCFFMQYPFKSKEKPTPGLLETDDVGATGGSILNDGAYSLMQSRDLNKSAGLKGLPHVFNLL